MRVAAPFQVIFFPFLVPWCLCGFPYLHEIRMNHEGSKTQRNPRQGKTERFFLSYLLSVLCALSGFLFILFRGQRTVALNAYPRRLKEILIPAFTTRHELLPRHSRCRPRPTADLRVDCRTALAAAIGSQKQSLPGKEHLTISEATRSQGPECIAGRCREMRPAVHGLRCGK